MEFQQMCPKFLGKQTTYLPSVPGRGGLCVPTQPLEVQDWCACADQPDHERAGWERAAAACPLLWHPPSPLLRCQGWLSRGWVTCSQGHTTSFPLLTVGALSRWIWGSAAGTYFLSLCQSHCFHYGSLVMVWSCSAIAVGEGGGEQEHPGDCQAEMWGSRRHRSGKDDGSCTLLIPSPICSKDTFCMPTHTF